MRLYCGSITLVQFGKHAPHEISLQLGFLQMVFEMLDLTDRTSSPDVIKNSSTLKYEIQNKANSLQQTACKIQRTWA